MLKKILLVVLLLAILSLCGCISISDIPRQVDSTSAFESTFSKFPPVEFVEVANDVFDNGKGTVYIKADPRPNPADSDTIMAAILNKKSIWENLFPAKRIQTWTSITNDRWRKRMSSSFGSDEDTLDTGTVGLLIYYNQD